MDIFAKAILTNNIRFVRMGQIFLPKHSMRSWITRGMSMTFLLLIAIFAGPVAAEPTFPILPGLEGAVAFWKQIFTRYGARDVVLFDPSDHGRIYSVLRTADTEEGRTLVERERARILASHDLQEEDGRLRTQRGVREQFVSGLKISGRYLVEMRKIFREEGVPPELVYLPLVESSFNVRARSAAGAVGMWQFMPDTGRKFLRITDTVDERRDPLASTRAAARLLKENRRLLGNWPLAVTAYNHGTEGMFRAINAVGTDDLVQIIKRYQSPTFGFASKNFYAEFLAALHVAKNSEAHFPFLRPHPPLSLREVEIKRAMSIQSFLKPAAVSLGDFFEWNPALSPTLTVIPAGYRVKVPAEKAGGFATLERRVLTTAIPKKRSVVGARKALGQTRGKAATKTRNAKVGAAGAASRSAVKSAPRKPITTARTSATANR
jgi:membrane-bound lytic murein transglycosylase D